MAWSRRDKIATGVVGCLLFGGVAICAFSYYGMQLAWEDQRAEIERLELEAPSDGAAGQHFEGAIAQDELAAGAEVVERFVARLAAMDAHGLPMTRVALLVPSVTPYSGLTHGGGGAHLARAEWPMVDRVHPSFDSLGVLDDTDLRMVHAVTIDLRDAWPNGALVSLFGSGAAGGRSATPHLSGDFVSVLRQEADEYVEPPARLDSIGAYRVDVEMVEVPTAVFGAWPMTDAMEWLRGGTFEQHAHGPHVMAAMRLLRLRAQDEDVQLVVDELVALNAMLLELPGYAAHREIRDRPGFLFRVRSPLTGSGGVGAVDVYEGEVWVE